MFCQKIHSGCMLVLQNTRPMYDTFGDRHQKPPRCLRQALKLDVHRCIIRIHTGMVDVETKFVRQSQTTNVCQLLIARCRD